MKFDDVFHYTGGYGFYQNLLVNILSLVVISTAFANIGTVFLNGKMDHYCKDLEITGSCNVSDYECGLAYLQLPPDDESTPFINETTCRKYVKLADNGTEITKCEHGWNYDRSQYESTIVSEFDLVCEDSYKVSLAASAFLFGYFFGSILFGAICDYYGRKRGIIIAFFMRTITGIVQSVAPSYWFYFVLRIMNGCMNIGLYIAIFVYVNEFVAPSKRALTSAIVYVYFNFGFLVLAFIAYFLRSWRTFYITVSACPVPLLIVYLFIPESPRWLLLKNRPEEAKVILQKVAKVNQKELPDDVFENIELHKENHSHGSLSKNSVVFNIFRYPNMRKKTMILIYCWFTVCLVYYGLTYGVEGLDVVVYLSISIIGIIEIVSTVVTWLAIQRFGRRPTLVFSMVMTGIMCFINIWIPTRLSVLRTTFSMIGRFFVTSTFSILYTYTTEIFSTDVRTIGVGICSFMARIAGILAPQILFLEKLWKPLPLVAFSFTSVSSGLLALLLPETLKFPLPQTLEEAELVTRNTNRCKTQKKSVELTTQPDKI